MTYVKLLLALLVFAPLANAQTQINCPPPNGCQMTGDVTITQSPTPPPQTVIVTPNVANLSTTGTQSFTATVMNDPFNRGVTWTLTGSGCSGSTCGTISSSSTASGVAITYTAPGTAPTPNGVTLTAMSVTNPQPNSSASAAIAITVPPATNVVNPCTPNAQTTAALNTFQCSASQGSALAIFVTSTSTTTVPSAVSVCTPANVCTNMAQGCPPTGSCRATVGGQMITGFYALGLTAGQTVYKVSNSAFAGQEQVIVFDQSNVNSFDTAVIGGSATASTTPSQSISTQAAGTVLSVDATTSATAITPPFLFVPSPNGIGAAYTVTSAAGTYSPSWIQQNAAYTLYSMAFANGFVSPVIGVTVNPTTASVATTSSIPVTATVANGTRGVTWMLSGSGCAGATCGTFATNGSNVAVTYTAPGAVPSPATVTLKATSVDDVTKSASSTITITATPVISVTVAPTTASVIANGTQTFTCTVVNDGAMAGCDWTLGGTSPQGSLSTAHTASGVALTYTAPSSASSAVTLTAASTTNPAKTAAAAIAVTAPAVSVAIAPTTATVNAGGSTQAFTATLTNSTAGVNWTLACTGTPCGTISPASSGGGGLSGWLGNDALTGTLAIGQTVTVNSNAGPVRSTVCTTAGGGVGAPISPQPSPVVGATVTIIGGPSPSCAGGFPYYQVQFPGGSGAISTATYTSPSSNTSVVVTLTATSITDGTKSASATINVTAVSSGGQVSCAGKACPAFLGVDNAHTAQGSGAAAVGGRGGAVYEVNDLSDNTHSTCAPNGGGTCSFRDVAQKSGPRIMIFRLSGRITFLSRMSITNPFLSVLGQTAPGGGIVIGGPGQGGNDQIFTQTHDLIFRYLTYDGNDPNEPTGPDTGTVCCEMASGNNYNIVWDHITTRWTGNKAFPGISDGVNASVHDTTLQWIFMYEPNACHPVGYGTLYVQSGSDLPNTNNDSHHNLFVSIDHRTPLNQSGVNTRVVNTIIYNYGQHSMISMGGVQTDAIGNKWIDGTIDPTHIVTITCYVNGKPTTYPANTNPNMIQYQNVHDIGGETGDGVTPPTAGDTTGNPGGDNEGPPSFYVLNNIGRADGLYNPSNSNLVNPTNVVNDSGQKSLTHEGWEGGDFGGAMPSAWFRSTPLPAPPFPIVADPVTNIDNVVLPTVGNSQHLDCLGNFIANRDSQDARVINIYQNRLPDNSFFPGLFAAPAIPAGTPCTESSHDGVADQWKTKYGLTGQNMTATDPATGLPFDEDYWDGLVP